MGERIDSAIFAPLDDKSQALAPPQLLQNGELAYMMVHFYWMLVYSKNDKNALPRLYQRSMYPDAPSPAHGHSVIRVGKDMRSPHELLPVKMCEGGNCLYYTVEGDPEGMSDDAQTYEVKLAGCDDFVFHMNSRGYRAIEGSSVDMKCHYFDKSIKLDGNSAMGTDYLLNFGYVEGTIDGEEVYGVGGCEFAFVTFTKMMTMSAYEVPPGQFYQLCGRCEDGSWDICHVTLKQVDDGTPPAHALFWNTKDPENWVSSYDVKFHADWEKVPYVKEDDPTMQPKNIVIKFADKTVHVEPKWAFRGFADPVDAEVGFSNGTGDFYEGDTPYAHDIALAMFEMQHITNENIPQNDF